METRLAEKINEAIVLLPIIEAVRRDLGTDRGFFVKEKQYKNPPLKIWIETYFSGGGHEVYVSWDNNLVFHSHHEEFSEDEIRVYRSDINGWIDAIKVLYKKAVDVQEKKKQAYLESRSANIR